MGRGAREFEPEKKKKRIAGAGTRSKERVRPSSPHQNTATIAKRNESWRKKGDKPKKKTVPWG